MIDVAPAQESQRGTLADAYVRTAPRAIRLAYLLTGDRTLAEDLVQEAFVRFVARLQYLRDPRAVDAYLRRTIVNLSRNHFRRKAVERAFLARQAGNRQPEHVEADVLTHEAMRRGPPETVTAPTCAHRASLLRGSPGTPDRGHPRV